MDIKEKINYWVEIAIDDLDSAKIMLKKKKFLQSGFYCHQAIEKMIKGYFWLIKNEEPPYTHNLLKLSDSSGLSSLLNEQQKKHIDMLMPLNIEARYPDDRTEILKTLDASKSKKVFKNTEEMLKWIMKLIEK